MCEEAGETKSELAILGDWMKVRTTVQAFKFPLHKAESGEKRREKRKTACEQRSRDDGENHTRKLEQKSGFESEGKQSKTVQIALHRSRRLAFYTNDT